MLTAVPTIAVFPEEKLTQSQKVEKWTWQLCRALEENYEQYYRRMITNNSERYSGNREDLSNYAKQQLAELDNRFMFTHKSEFKTKEYIVQYDNIKKQIHELEK